ncbi:MAG TPA: tryptophan synthase subunit alpha [Candidatus Omnitrophica bacterium]|nr:tryptophan synthase subunit alpha [Candidatus Omnitrophota bacterium]
MSRLQDKFRELKINKKCAFIAYITAGDPNLKITKDLILELEKQGADIIELGVPFSDPLADGPVIQRASIRALKNKTNLSKIIRLVKEVRPKVKIPVCLMTYYNPVYKFGLDKFTKAASIAGVDGVIIPDLPPEEAGEFMRFTKRVKLDTVFFVSPMSTDKRIKLAVKASSGFIYYVALTGVTGARNKLGADLKKKVSQVKRYTHKPVCTGFGISRLEHVKELSRFCDGVIVGSAIVNKIENNLGNKNLVKIVGNFVRTLSKGL